MLWSRSCRKVGWCDALSWHVAFLGWTANRDGMGSADAAHVSTPSAAMSMLGALCQACGAVWAVDVTRCTACGALEQARVVVGGPVEVPPAGVHDVEDDEMTLDGRQVEVLSAAAAQPKRVRAAPSGDALDDVFGQRAPRHLPTMSSRPPNVSALRTAPGGGSFGFPVITAHDRPPDASFARLLAPRGDERRRATAIGVSTVGVILVLAWLVAGGPRVLLFLLLAGLVIGVLVELVVGERNARARRIAIASRVRTGMYLGLPPDDAAGAVVQQLTASGARVSTYTTSLITGTVTVKRRPNLLLAVLLWLVCVVPMIIYVVSASKDVTQAFSVRLEPSGEGVRAFPVGEGEALERVARAVVSVTPCRSGTTP